MTASEVAVRRGIEELAKSGHGDFVGPISDELIAKAERLLGVAFTPGYRLFVSHLGCGHVGGTEFYGLIGEPVDKGPIPNVVWYTSELRDDGLTQSCLAVHDLGDGTVFLLDTNDPQENLLAWFPGVPDTEPLGQTFGELFLEAVQEAR